MGSLEVLLKLRFLWATVLGRLWRRADVVHRLERRKYYTSDEVLLQVSWGLELDLFIGKNPKVMLIRLASEKVASLSG